MDVRELALGKLKKMENGVIVLDQPEPSEDTIRKATLDLSVDPRTVRTKMETISREARHAAYNDMVSQEQDKVEIEEEVRTDAITINNGKPLEVAAVKAINSAMNKVTEEDYLYGLVSLTVSIQNHEETSILELKDPTYYTEVVKLVARDKIRMVENQAIRNMNATGFKLSAIVPLSDGAFTFNDENTFNRLLEAIGDFKAKYARAVNNNLANRIGPEEIYADQVAIKNKSRIRSYLSSKLPSDMDTYEKIQILNNQVGELFDDIGVKPLTNQTIQISFQLDKVHYAPEGTFSSTARNVSILKDSDRHELKIERTSFSQQFKLPYLEEVLNINELIALETLFTVWAENEARELLGFEVLALPEVRLANWNQKDLKISEDLKISPESVTRIFKEIQSKIDKAIEMDKLQDLR